jgi:dipeptidyl aminopeptidase/acylaminoacyl peptidase
VNQIMTLARAVRSVIAGFVTAAWLLGAMATEQTDSDRLIEAFTSPRSFQAITLSPDGRHLAALGFNGLGFGVFVGDTASLQFKLVVDSRRIDTLNYRYVRNPLEVRWIDNELLAIGFNDDEAESVDLAGRKVASLGARYIGPFAGKAEAPGPWVLVALDAEAETLAVVNPRTGERLRYDRPPPGKLLDAAYDGQGVLRAATTIDTTFWTERTTVSQWYRADEQADWQLLEAGPVTADHWSPMYVPAEPDTLIVQSRHDRDTKGIFRYDTRKRAAVELMAGHPAEDIVYASGLGSEILRRVRTSGLKSQTHWFDARWASLQATVDKVLPNHVNLLDGNPQGSVLVFSYADVDPGRWFVLDTTALTLKEVAQVAPHIRAEAMRPMQTLRYVARDGTRIPAYLTLPDASGPQPMVVLIHGGPAARDHWAWDAEVQLLAARGYVVFQPQFRGSTGFGAAFERAGRGQWGLGMQDDVTDGVRHLIEQKVADPRRICIYGTSYGGYSALWGLVKTPELYRCGVSLAGATDIEALLAGRSDFNRNPAARELFRFRLGTLAKERPSFEAVSPLKHAHRIQVPVLIAHGEKDARVPVSHGRNMVEALKAHGKAHEWMLFEREGHGLVYVSNQRKYYKALLAFLDRHIGAAAGASVAPAPVEAAPPERARHD